MLGWTKYQEENYGITNEYEKVKITNALKIACDDILNYIVDNKIDFPVRPLIKPDYAEHIIKHKERFDYTLPDACVLSWLNDSKFQRAMALPIREISSFDLPEDVVKNALTALQKQENVYKDAAMFRFIKLEPGDQVMLHYDPKTSYHSEVNIQWLEEHKGKYIDKRAFVYMNDRQPGQVSWLGKSEIDYKKYDMYKFEVDKVYHGTANFGYDDRYMICFSWAEPLG